MKKTLVALAIAGAFSGAAFAQSSVVMYGIADVNVQVTDPKAGTSVNVPKTVGINSGGQSGSRFGVRGSEALGNGINAIFQLENGYNIDTGTLGQSDSKTNTYRLFGRQAYVGLTGGFGGVVLGRLATFSSGTGSFDKFGSVADIGSTGFGYAGTQSVMTSSNSLRADNAIGYVSPKFAGVSFGYAHSTRVDGQEGTGVGSGNNHGDIAYVDFATGPMAFVLTYDRLSFREGAAAALDNHVQQNYQLGGKYDFGFLVLQAGFAYEKNLVSGFGLAAPVSNGLLQSSGGNAKAGSIGVTFPFGANAIAANYQERRWDKKDVGATNLYKDGKRRTFAVEYTYTFSKRTNLYAYYTDVRDSGSAKTPNWGGAQQYAVGLRHQF
jgi:predicted porin